MYQVDFPPGSMGLELEPVIISSERQLGCRVKDFYFDVDHLGIAKENVMKSVSLGDIISSIEGESVISLTFNEILSRLRSLKSTNRTVVFKNIAATC
jgi:hypothetical protein